MERRDILLEEFFENELARKFEDMIENNDELYFDTEEYEDIIIYYLELGDISYAELATKYALKLHPSSIELKTKQLEVFLELERYSKAKELIDELKASCMDMTDFLVCCAKYYSNLGNPRRSIEYCEKALELEEEENFLHNFIADEFINLDDPFNALKHYTKALHFDPQDDYSLENIMSCYNRLNHYQDALGFINQYLDRYPFSEMAWFEFGQLQFNKKKYEEAISAFDYLLAINPSSVSVYANKAACFEALGEWLKAVEVYEEMLELEYTKAFTYYKIGLCFKEHKSPIQALSFFQKALIEDPQFYLAMMEQSFIYEEMGKLREAVHFARESVLLNETNVDYQKRLAFLYIESGDFEDSLQCFETLVAVEPTRFYNWYAYSEVLMLLEEYDNALVVLDKAIQQHNRAELHYQRSNCYFHLNLDKEGTASLTLALEMDANLSEDMQQKYPSIKEAVIKVKTKKK